MAYRVVKINHRCKLETQLGYLVVRSDKETKIFLDDIELLIVENQQTCLTSALISELMTHNVRVLFCDSKHNPQGELNPYSTSYNCFAKYKHQSSWDEEIKDQIWSLIVHQKIKNQSLLLKSKRKDDAFSLLTQYLYEIEPGDRSNREGLAAKVYFSALFGSDFDRRKDSDVRNTYLNYAYSLILSAMNREISALGYFNPVGIHHIGETNPFNLGCDFVEPFRPFADKAVLDGGLTKENFKSELLKLFSKEIHCNDKVMLLENAIHDYILSVLSALNRQSMPSLAKVTFLDEQL